MEIFSKEVSDMIRARKGEARRKDLVGKANYILRQLGDRVPDSEMEDYTYEQGGLSLSVKINEGDEEFEDDENIRIEFCERRVFESHGKGDVEAYVPGERWESDLEKLYLQAQADTGEIAEDPRGRLRISVDDDLQNKWGL